MISGYDNIILSPVPLEQLIAQLRVIIREEISAEHKLENEKLISPEESCKVFTPSISKVTLHKWTQDGYLTKYRIGGRTYFKRSEIIEAAKKFTKYKPKKVA